MSTTNGYHLHKTGERVSELLSRQFIVPTLDSVPTRETLKWIDGDYEVNFRIGELVRVKFNDEYKFYRLKDIYEGKALWVDANESDLNNYYTKLEIDNKLQQLVIPAASGGVELVSEEEYNLKKENGEIEGNVMYFIVVDDEPYELYIGYHLIGKKGDSENTQFPYTFPIIF